MGRRLSLRRQRTADECPTASAPTLALPTASAVPRPQQASEREESPPREGHRAAAVAGLRNLSLQRPFGEGEGGRGCSWSGKTRCHTLDTGVAHVSCCRNTLGEEKPEGAEKDSGSLRVEGMETGAKAQEALATAADASQSKQCPLLLVLDDQTSERRPPSLGEGGSTPERQFSPAEQGYAARRSRSPRPHELLGTKRCRGPCAPCAVRSTDGGHGVPADPDGDPPHQRDTAQRSSLITSGQQYNAAGQRQEGELSERPRYRLELQLPEDAKSIPLCRESRSPSRHLDALDQMCAKDDCHPVAPTPVSTLTERRSSVSPAPSAQAVLLEAGAPALGYVSVVCRRQGASDKGMSIDEPAIASCSELVGAQGASTVSSAPECCGQQDMPGVPVVGSNFGKTLMPPSHEGTAASVASSQRSVIAECTAHGAVASASRLQTIDLTLNGRPVDGRDLASASVSHLAMPDLIPDGRPVGSRDLGGCLKTGEAGLLTATTLIEQSSSREESASAFPVKHSGRARAAASVFDKEAGEVEVLESGAPSPTGGAADIVQLTPPMDNSRQVSPSCPLRQDIRAQQLPIGQGSNMFAANMPEYAHGEADSVDPLARARICQLSSNEESSHCEHRERSEAKERSEARERTGGSAREAFAADEIQGRCGICGLDLEECGEDERARHISECRILLGELERATRRDVGREQLPIGAEDVRTTPQPQRTPLGTLQLPAERPRPAKSPASKHQLPSGLCEPPAVLQAAVVSAHAAGLDRPTTCSAPQTLPQARDAAGRGAPTRRTEDELRPPSCHAPATIAPQAAVACSPPVVHSCASTELPDAHREQPAHARRRSASSTSYRVDSSKLVRGRESCWALAGARPASPSALAAPAYRPFIVHGRCSSPTAEGLECSVCGFFIDLETGAACDAHGDPLCFRCAGNVRLFGRAVSPSHGKVRPVVEASEGVDDEATTRIVGSSLRDGHSDAPERTHGKNERAQERRAERGWQTCMLRNDLLGGWAHVQRVLGMGGQRAIALRDAIDSLDPSGAHFRRPSVSRAGSPGRAPNSSHASLCSRVGIQGAMAISRAGCIACVDEAEALWMDAAGESRLAAQELPSDAARARLPQHDAVSALSHGDAVVQRQPRSTSLGPRGGDLIALAAHVLQRLNEEWEAPIPAAIVHALTTPVGQDRMSRVVPARLAWLRKAYKEIDLSI